MLPTMYHSLFSLPEHNLTDQYLPEHDLTDRNVTEQSYQTQKEQTYHRSKT
jgi:hypothetical protein